MTTKFKSGLLKGILYYAIGFIIAWVTYLIFGWTYIHGPGMHHIVGFLFLVGGACWTLYYLTLLLIGEKSKINYGTLTIHGLIIISFIVFIFIITYTSDDLVTATNPDDIITIHNDEKTNESSIVTGNGDTLFSKKGDTVLIDKIKTDTNNYR